MKVNAFMRGRQARRRGAWKLQKGAWKLGGVKPGHTPVPVGATGPPMKCVKCGKEGHRAADCRGANMEAGQRPCFKCGKTGHIARDYKEVNAIEGVPTVATALCLAGDQAEAIHRGKLLPPRGTAGPPATTVASFIVPTYNRFSGLTVKL